MGVDRPLEEFVWGINDADRDFTTYLKQLGHVRDLIDTGNEQGGKSESSRIPRSTFGLPNVPVAVRTSLRSCWKARKAPMFTLDRQSSGEPLVKSGGGHGSGQAFSASSA
jgi:hypothetical protein